MAKLRTRFVCQACGDTKPREIGRCPECGNWNSYAEESLGEPARWRNGHAKPSTKPQSLSHIAVSESYRISSGMAELDRVLGGGIVPGSLILLGGEPGAGKSTLTLQTAHNLASAGHRVLYVSGEESLLQVRLRAERLGATASDLMAIAECDMDAILIAIRETSPALVVIDSIQCVNVPGLDSPRGSVSQIREATVCFQYLAKTEGPAICLVGHVTKDGSLAGPRVLEHIVDTVLAFEGDRLRSYRLLRAVKNRFGSTQEIGVFEMRGNGMVEVPNPSSLFLGERLPDATGSAIAVPLEGSRPLLVEVQALVAPTFLASPRRSANGVDSGRLVQILAVLERRAGVPLSTADVYTSVVGGLEISDPASDLAVALAIASGMRDRPLPRDLVVIGELGLGGEIRSVARLEQRLREAAKLGFGRAIVPGANQQNLAVPPGMAILPVCRLNEALIVAQGEDDACRGGECEN